MQPTSTGRVESPSLHSAPSLLLADDDLTLQIWIMAHIELIVPVLLARQGDVAPELVAGVIALSRVLFVEAKARDAVSARLWCDLSLAETTPPVQLTLDFEQRMDAGQTKFEVGSSMFNVRCSTRRTLNIEHPTLNIEHRTWCHAR